MTSETSKILQITIGLFNATPGAEHLASFINAVRTGGSLEDMSRTLADHPVFTEGMLGNSVTTSDKALVLLHNFGLDTSSEAGDVAFSYFSDRISAGDHIGSIIDDAIEYLNGTPDPMFAEAIVLLNKKTIVSDYYSSTLGLGTEQSTLEELQAILGGISLDTDVSTVEALNAVIADATGILIIESPEVGEELDSGSASQVIINATNPNDDILITVNGDVDLKITNSTAHATITVTADSEINYSSSTTSTTVAGDGNVILNVDSAEISGDQIVNALNTGTLTVAVSGAADTDLTHVNADLIVLIDDFGGTTITVADGAHLAFGVAQTSVVTILGDPANDTNTITIDSAFNINALDISDDGLTTILHSTADITIAQLIATGETVFLTGNGNVEISQSDAAVFDASAFNGELTYHSDVAATMTGGNGADTIIGSPADDIITGGPGADKLTGGEGNDVFIFNEGDSPEAKIASISDFSLNSDTLDLVVGAIADDIYEPVNVSSADADGTASDILADVTNGIVTLSGADAGAIDTLAEWIAVLETANVIVTSDTRALSIDLLGVGIVIGELDPDALGTVAFEFNGNTYIAESNDTLDNNTSEVDLVNIVELTGVTGITDLAGLNIV